MWPKIKQHALCTKQRSYNLWKHGKGGVRPLSSPLSSPSSPTSSPSSLLPSHLLTPLLTFFPPPSSHLLLNPFLHFLPSPFFSSTQTPLFFTPLFLTLYPLPFTPFFPNQPNLKTLTYHKYHIFLGSRYEIFRQYRKMCYSLTGKKGHLVGNL